MNQKQSASVRLAKTIAGHTRRSVHNTTRDGACSALTAVGESARGSAGNVRPINGDLQGLHTRLGQSDLPVQPDVNYAPVDKDLATHWSYARLLPLPTNPKPRQTQ
jgi:hypothetical protein